MAIEMDDTEKLRDPLHTVTRKQRRFLLGLSTAGIVLATTGWVPTRVTALGIEFSPSDQSSLLWVLSAIVTHCLIAFAIYISSDLTNFRLVRADTLARRKEIVANYERTRQPYRDGTPESYRLSLAQNEKAAFEYKRLRELEGVTNTFQKCGVLRAWFESMIPMIIAVLSIVMLVRKAILVA